MLVDKDLDAHVLDACAVGRALVDDAAAGEVCAGCEGAEVDDGLEDGGVEDGVEAGGVLTGLCVVAGEPDGESALDLDGSEDVVVAGKRPVVVVGRLEDGGGDWGGVDVDG